jgi:hypothetical protein
LSPSSANILNVANISGLRRIVIQRRRADVENAEGVGGELDQPGGQLAAATLRPVIKISGVQHQGETADMKKSRSRSKAAESPSALIDARIEGLGDWRGEMLSRLRALIKAADPEVVEEWKWGGTPVWSHDGLICTGETYRNVVKMTFAKGASLEDPSGLFNSSLDGNVRRAIDFHEGDKPNAAALKALIRAAVALNARP